MFLNVLLHNLAHRCQVNEMPSFSSPLPGEAICSICSLCPGAIDVIFFCLALSSLYVEKPLGVAVFCFTDC